MTSRYTSLSEEQKNASKFGQVFKVRINDLEDLAKAGQIKILRIDDIVRMMAEAGEPERKIRGVVQDMIKNKELLIEGQIPAEMVKRCK